MPYGVDMASPAVLSPVAARARAWRNSAHLEICDALEPWAYGTVRRATRYPSYFDFNGVLVEQDPAMSVDELMAFADRALAGLAHRRIDFDVVAAAERYRAGFESRGWKAMRLLWMHHEAPPPPGPDVVIEQVAYDAVYDLRAAWHREDFRPRTTRLTTPTRATSRCGEARGSWPCATRTGRSRLPRSSATLTPPRSRRSTCTPITAVAGAAPR